MCILWDNDIKQMMEVRPVMFWHTTILLFFKALIIKVEIFSVFFFLNVSVKYNVLFELPLEAFGKSKILTLYKIILYLTVKSSP